MISELYILSKGVKKNEQNFLIQLSSYLCEFIYVDILNNHKWILKKLMKSC